MIRLTWMQFRLQALIGALALAVIAVVLAVTGPGLHHLYTTEVLNCRANGDCSGADALFLRNNHSLWVGLDLLVDVVPALLGLFWGAPLVAREFEMHTYRLVWTETTRTRWIAVKLAGIGLASIAVAGILSLIVTWWSSPLDAAQMKPFSSFDQRDVVPLAYAAFAFVVGVTAGLLIRKTVPAMATALALFIAARFAVTEWVRPYLLSPLRLIVSDTTLGAVGPQRGGATLADPRDWLISDQTINATGHVIGTSGSIGNSIGAGQVQSQAQGVVVGPGYSCPNIKRPTGSFSHQQVSRLMQECVNQLHIRELLTYQPTSRYWPLQWSEFGIFLGATFLLGGFCLWRMGRRLA